MAAIRLISENESKSHAGQQKASVRKKAKKAAAREKLSALARQEGVSEVVIRQRLQKEVNAVREKVGAKFGRAYSPISYT